MNKIVNIVIQKTAKGLFVLILLIAINHSLCAQNPVLLECVNINKAYQASGYLSFNVSYTYAPETSPTDIQDSSQALYKLKGLKYWGSIDSVEFMQNDSFQITLHHRENLITLGLPTYNQPFTLPMSQWDSIFLHNDKFTYSIGVDAGYKKITVDYDANMPYKKFELWYDSATYRVNRMRYQIDYNTSDDSYDKSGTLSGAFAEVNIYFSNYQTDQFTDDVFNSAYYITKIGGIYYPAGDYETYELFIVSPDLK